MNAESLKRFVTNPWAYGVIVGGLFALLAWVIPNSAFAPWAAFVLFGVAGVFHMAVHNRRKRRASASH